MDDPHKDITLHESDEEYAAFRRVALQHPPRTYPYCQTQTIRMLWLGDPDSVIAEQIWGKWYLWCEQCLKGIRPFFQSSRVPPGEPYIRWGDDEALKRALPSGLRLVFPATSKDNRKRDDLQRLFNAARGIKSDEPGPGDGS